MEKTKIILDCDPGHDDAVAIILAGKNPAIDLLGITIVSGNQTLDKTVRNALNVVQHLGIDVPVYGGCTEPMVRKKVVAGDIHGESGLDGPVFPPLERKPEPEHAVNFMIRTLMESEGDITVVTTGPMTNLAMAMRMEPKIAEKIKQIVLMGGAIANGNVSPAAEFNIMADAEAAYVCFTSGRPITMVGLDVTRKVLCYPEIVERMGKIENRASKLFVDLMGHFCKTQKEVFGWEGGPLHDPVTLAYLIDPSVLKVKPMNVRIDIRSTDSYGRTNCDVFDYLHLPHTADVAMDIDVERFWDIIEENIRLYD
ncbi:MAG: nucleoside hydrolase [Oscillospiraceae bacterium]|nr:nucleoside hydrolase [Oscillospiraceae bacterium]MBQ3499851.1 nucleoside hydrolase [Oscillospiraceae bacterium]MBQ4547361.1 nucleoside hydrolase [Oscillospiraceae bacterium]MBQ4643043.1 nucleoside hydrolase [Oscillospiraceae bacterium]